MVFLLRWGKTVGCQLAEDFPVMMILLRYELLNFEALSFLCSCCELSSLYLGFLFLSVAGCVNLYGDAF